MTQYKPVIVAAIFVLVSVALVFFVLMPSLQNLRQNQTSLAEKQAVLTEKQTTLASLEKLNKNIGEFNMVYDNINNLWPDTTNVSGFIVQVEGLAKEQNIVIDNFSVDEANSSKKEGSDDISKGGTGFTLTAKSTYPVFFDFLTKLQSMARLNSITKISLGQETGDSLSINITGKIYYGE